MTRAATQTERLIAAARRYKGVSRIDFALPDVIDGGDPILNFPGRMWDAEQKGFSFEVIGKRNRCSVFRLVFEPESEAGSSSASLALSPEVETSRGVPPHFTAGLSSEQGSLFAGIERRKGTRGYGEEEAA